jgi:aquaporin Z
VFLSSSLEKESLMAKNSDVVEHTMTARVLAEMWGTFVLVIGLIGAALFAAGFKADSNGAGILGVAFAVGIAVLAAAYSVGHISGAHFNPAVSIGLAFAGRLPWKDVPYYLAAQFVGAVIATSVLFMISSDGPAGFLVASTRSGFAANGFGEGSPGGFGLVAVIIAEIVFTAILVWVVLGTTHKLAVVGFAPLAIGLTLTLIHIVTIPVSNTSVNPARSFATAIYGGPLAMEQLWVFFVAPLAGAVIAGLSYAALMDRSSKEK